MKKNFFLYAVALSLGVFTTYPVQAAKICVKPNGKLVTKKRCRKTKGETRLDLSDISTLAVGATGAKGEKGDKGEQGEQGETGTYPTTLQSGQTITGYYYAGATASAAGELALTELSFPIPLESKPTSVFISAQGASTTECPGTANDPRALPGYLCVYEANFNSVQVANTSSHQGGDGTTTLYGTGIFVVSSAAGVFFSQGSWAVTGE